MFFFRCLLLSFTLMIISASPRKRLTEARATINHNDMYVMFEFLLRGDSTLVCYQFFGFPVYKWYDFHIHEKPVKGNDCYSTGEHWNPTGSTWKNSCNPFSPGRCIAGDLSAKHGKIVGEGTRTVVKKFTDPSLKWSTSQRGFLDKSIVIHDPKNPKTRIACATIKAVND